MTDSGWSSSLSLRNEDCPEGRFNFQPGGVHSSPWNTIIRPVADEMCELMSPKELAYPLYSKKLISRKQLTSLDQMAKIDAAFELLTEILPRKGPQAFATFVSVLEETEGQEFLVEQFDLRRGVSSHSGKSARSGESGNSLRSKVANLERENAMLEERNTALESFARSKIKQKELIEMGLRLEVRGYHDSDLRDDDFETSGPRPNWFKIAEVGGIRFSSKWWRTPPLPSNKLPFTAIQGKAIFAEKGCKLVVVDMLSRKQLRPPLPKSFGLICALERCQDTCFAVVSQNRRMGIHEYFVSLNKWKFIDDIPGGHLFLSVSVASNDRHLYIIGSIQMQERYSNVLSFNTESKKWNRLPDLQSSVMFPSVVWSDNSLIVGGCASLLDGSEDENEFSACLEFDIKRLPLKLQRWIDLGTTSEWNPRLNVIHNQVIATGGLPQYLTTIYCGYLCKKDNSPVKPVELEDVSMKLLDPCTMQWLPLPPLPVDSDSLAKLSTCVTEQQSLLVLNVTKKDHRCHLYEMDIPCDMSSELP